MPRLIDAGDGDAIGLDELVATLDDPGFDPRDEDGFAAYGPLLARLGRNRRFLGDLVSAELEARCAGQVRGNGYSAQVIMLHRGANYFLRANFWPSAGDPIARAGGLAPFFYGVPHDHNFSFLTVGYLGPGYESDYWEATPGAIAGYPGEPVSLKRCGRHQLGQGEVMLYRAGVDVHSQLPPSSLSVTINIMQSTDDQIFRDQYRFTPDGAEVAGILSTSGLDALLPLAAQLGGDAGRALVDEFAARHPSGRVRMAAIDAAAGAAGSPDARGLTYARATADPSALIRETARARLRRIEAGAGWGAG